MSDIIPRTDLWYPVERFPVDFEILKSTDILKPEGMYYLKTKTKKKT